MTRDQAKVLEIIVGIVLKVVMAIVSIVAFFRILNFVLADVNRLTLNLAFLEFLLGGGIFTIIRHYFPAIAKSKDD